MLLHMKYEDHSKAVMSSCTVGVVYAHSIFNVPIRHFDGNPEPEGICMLDQTCDDLNIEIKETFGLHWLLTFRTALVGSINMILEAKLCLINLHNFFCFLTAGIASVNLNNFCNAYRVKYMWISRWYALNILKDDFVSTTSIEIKLFKSQPFRHTTLSLSYTVILWKNEMGMMTRLYLSEI